MKHILAALFLFLPTFAAACEGATPCVLGERSYHVKTPDGWDGTSPLPVLLHFHGWGRTGAIPVNHARISAHTARRGVLLLAPTGVNRSWDFWRAGSADVPFATAVIEDAARRFPIDRSRIYVSGYSYGSAMAWRYVCENGFEVAALLAVAGSLPQDTDCPQAPRAVRHVHGLADTVMDFPMGAGGDRTHPVALWRDAFGCGDAADTYDWQAVSWLQFQRTEWACDGGVVALDVHSGGHFIPHGWVGWQLDELMGRKPVYP